jgi:hypothetical protein
MGMPPEELNQVSRIVGGLEAKIESFEQNWQEQDRRAADGRKILYDKFSDLQLGFQNLGHKVSTVMADVAEMKPAVTDWVRTKDKALGAKTAASILGKLAYGLAGAIMLGIGWAIDHFLVVPHGH